MPTWDEITNNLDMLKLLEKYVEDLSYHTSNTTICYLSAFSVIKPAVPSIFHSIIDADMQGFMTCSNKVKKDRLDLILHTPGGDLEATKRIITYLRKIYREIRVIVPLLAMSGGTMIACSSDKILMGPYSNLGPTDPQVLIGQNYVPVGAIIKEFNLAFEEVKKNVNTAPLWIERLKAVPFGMYQSILNIQAHSKEELEYILFKYMFKDNPEKKETASNIAKFFTSFEKHSSHAKGICLDDAIKEGLIVEDLSKDKILEDKVLSIFHISTKIFEASITQKIIINNIGKKYIVSSHFQLK